MRNQVVPHERIVVYTRDRQPLPEPWRRMKLRMFVDGDLVVGFSFTDGPHGRVLFSGTDRCTEPDGHKRKYPPQEGKPDVERLTKIANRHLVLVNRDDGFVEHRFTVYGMVRSWLASPEEMASPNYRQRLWNRMSIEERELHLLKSVLLAMPGHAAPEVSMMSARDLPIGPCVAGVSSPDVARSCVVLPVGLVRPAADGQER